MQEEKKRSLDLAIQQIEKAFGKGSIMRLGEKEIRLQENTISTGSISLDSALGIGGIPRGRVMEIFGPESSGKTTLALHMIAEAQKKGGIAAFIDAEHALDPKYAENLGVDVENLLISQPDTGEQALEIMETLARSGATDIIVVDSVAALVPRAEIEGEMGDSHMGLQARLMSQALRKLTSVLSKSKTAAVFLNQERMKIGVFFGSPMTTPGGLALKFHASVRLDIHRVSPIKKGDQKIGNHLLIRVVKNKLAPPFRDAEFDILFGKGISKEGELIDIGVKEGMISKSGTWFSYGNERLGQGKENAVEYLYAHPEIRDEVERKVREKKGLVKTEEGKEKKEEG
ncbi:recombinase RecA [candidate division WOR-3 bacterium JGI_Cruoil_03_44_89]|uniref:Protein RecA n=1 Tax=candidate division WOR-3 bacterium JGI_Cruoil_03_44_89 TaxID=1973748 RepID=A0A235BRA9_UNCW3|nr:MAG: recombinase RecA [candidate division WOR-3 bacterium JGI_Cruoil_03_44_89]